MVGTGQRRTGTGKKGYREPKVADFNPPMGTALVQQRKIKEKRAMLERTPHSAPYTAHPATGGEATPVKNRTGSGGGQKGSIVLPGAGPVYGCDGYGSNRRQAEDSDAADRKAWAGRKYRAAYSSLLNLPVAVRAGDRGMAGFILGRVRGLLERGGWTRSENRRLWEMERAWARRAAGKDPTFNHKGWRADGRLGDCRAAVGWAGIARTLAEAVAELDRKRGRKRNGF